MSRIREEQYLISRYKAETGIKEIDMHEVARFAASKGHPLPKPADPIDLLARSLSKAAREETRQDKQTGQTYRVYHAFPRDGGRQGEMLWVDIDEAPRKHMVKSAVMRREQMVGDALQLTLDLEHWNSVNPADEPITVPLDLSEDVEERKAADQAVDQLV